MFFWGLDGALVTCVGCGLAHEIERDEALSLSTGEKTEVVRRGIRSIACMHPTTQQIIAFLSHPDLPFGAEEDVLLLADPEALQTRVAFLLEEHPAILGGSNTESLKQQLGEADWPFIAQEFRARVQLVSGFFDADAHASADSAS